jgi:hypothetical protein
MSKKISWKKGSASLIIIMATVLMTIYLLLLYMTLTNILYSNTVATTRTDIIADSTAVYAQSYDYKYNKSQADIMATLLTTYNDAVSDSYSLTSNIFFPQDDTLKIKTTVRTRTFYPELLGSNFIYSYGEATVKSVDVWGDILVVPSEIGNNNHQYTPTVDTNDVDGVLGN